MSTPHRVAVLALPGVSAMELGIPLEIFGTGATGSGRAAGGSSPAAAAGSAAGGSSPAVAAGSAAGAPVYCVDVVGASSGLVVGASGLEHRVELGLAALESAGTILIPGATSALDGEPPAAVTGALLAAHERGARIAALSSGVFVLARTGLLDGKRATTHWAHAKALTRRFPMLDVDENVLFIDEGQVLTSAGAASTIDLCLHLIRGDRGVGLSNQVARGLVAAAYRSAGQAQYVPRSVPEPLGDLFADTREWALAHLGEPLTLAHLASTAGVSVRTFSRRFVEDTGYTPMQWVLRARVDLARELLENSDLGIEQIADQVGLGTGANLRMHFQRILSTSPNEYRHSFSG